MKDPGVSPGCCRPNIIKAFFVLAVSAVEILIKGMDLPVRVEPIVSKVTLGLPLMPSKSFFRSEIS